MANPDKPSPELFSLDEGDSNWAIFVPHTSSLNKTNPEENQQTRQKCFFRKILVIFINKSLNKGYLALFRGHKNV